MQIDRRTFLAAGATGLAFAATRAAWAAPRPAAARFVINVAGPRTGLAALSWGPLVNELQKRGFATTIVEGIKPNATFTDNSTRAAGIIAALKDVTEPVVIVGISNEGGYLPLVAAARPVRRLVYVNACIPQPGKAFVEMASTEPFAVPGSFLDTLIVGAQPVTDEFLKLRADPNATAEQWQTFRDHVQASKYASSMKNFYEVCPLERMPEVENVDISGAADDQIRPAWEQAAARRVLKVEPVVIPGAKHADIVVTYAVQVADAAVRGL
jgi:hypothetical protein